VFSFLTKKTEPIIAPLRADIHSHLLPGIDDGVKSLDESLSVILEFKKLGYQKLITTPHIISDSYKNTPEIILGKLNELKTFLFEKKVDITIEAAAEYYLDTWLINEVKTKKELLTFGNKFILFEMNYVSEPFQLNDFIFQLITQGYKPILAHPERYQFMTLEKAEDIRSRGVYLQVNILSLVGNYSKPIRKMAEQLIDRGIVDFLGSDCHNLQHILKLKKAFDNKYFKKALELPLLNNSL